MAVAKDAANSAARQNAKNDRRTATNRARRRNGTPRENPRTVRVRSREKFEQACELIKGELAGRDWVSSIAIHRKFNGKIAERMYGRVKSALAR